jgi:hypothetical protein
MIKYLFATVILLVCADANTTCAQNYGGSCGANPLDIGDNFAMWDVNNGWGCQQQFINYWWSAYDMDVGDWDGDLGYNYPCNNDKALARAFNGMWHLGYVGTNTPNCDTAALNKTLWAQCWATSKTDEIDGSCADDDTATATGCQDCLGDCRTTLKEPFFFGNNPARRAATLFHEARHTGDGGCGHNGGSGCARGRSCEVSWDHGCSEILQFYQRGANAYQVIYIESYVFFGWRTTSGMKTSMVSLGNYLLDKAFNTPPCKNMLSNGLIVSC